MDQDTEKSHNVNTNDLIISKLFDILDAKIEGRDYKDISNEIERLKIKKIEFPKITINLKLKNKYKSKIKNLIGSKLIKAIY